jgi:hypothetical protein
MFQTKVAEKVKTHMLCSIIFFLEKSCLSRDNVEKCVRARQATDGDIMRRAKEANCMPDSYGKCRDHHNMER